MTSFVQPEFPRTHGGAIRLANAVERAHMALGALRSPKGLASVLLAGGLSAAIVVAEQVVTALTDGHLLLAWIAMWAIVFGLLAVFSEAIRGWPEQLQAWLRERSRAAHERAADEQLWAAAQADPRLMAELDCALQRAQSDALAGGREPPHWPFAGMPRQKPPSWNWA